jgi:hypothetical protein
LAFANARDSFPIRHLREPAQKLLAIANSRRTPPAPQGSRQAIVPQGFLAVGTAVAIALCDNDNPEEPTLRTEHFIPADQLAPAVAFNDWLSERLRSILDAAPRRQDASHPPRSHNA